MGWREHNSRTFERDAAELQEWSAALMAKAPSRVREAAGDSNYMPIGLADEPVIGCASCTDEGVWRGGPRESLLWVSMLIDLLPVRSLAAR